MQATTKNFFLSIIEFKSMSMRKWINWPLMIIPDREQTFHFFQTSRFPNTTSTLRYSQQIRIQESLYSIL